MGIWFCIATGTRSPPKYCQRAPCAWQRHGNWLQLLNRLIMFSFLSLQFSDPGPSFAGAFTSVSSPVLTPTTLANLEQTFIELTAVPSQASSGVTNLTTTVSSQLPTDLSSQGPRQSGFVPPVVDLNIVPKTEPFYHDDSSSSDPEWYPSAKRQKTSVTGSAIVIAPDSTTAAAGQGRRRPTGPRRSRNEHVSTEDTHTQGR